MITADMVFAAGETTNFYQELLKRSMGGNISHTIDGLDMLRLNHYLIELCPLGFWCIVQENFDDLTLIVYWD